MIAGRGAERRLVAVEYSRRHDLVAPSGPQIAIFATLAGTRTREPQ
jgi:hypothetical protein